MADDNQQQDECESVAKILADDPRANLVAADGEVWFLTGRAVDIARTAIDSGEAASPGLGD